MASLLPETIIGVDKQPVASAALAGKVLGLYFSAHWCPPCREFTPRLCAWYSNFKAKHPSADQLEIVFLSSDKDEAAFKEYHNEMNFCAVPFADREVKEALSSKFNVRGIPTLVFVDAQGNKLTRDGRSIVNDDPEGSKFPWAPKSFEHNFGGVFVNNKDESFGLDTLSGKVLGLYFSAHWCPPCRGFTPVLTAAYNKLKADGKPFEIIFLSRDRDDATYKEYFASMPWLSLGYNQDVKDRVAGLFEHFDVCGIPTLIILDENRNIITPEGRWAIDADPAGENFPWRPKAINAFGNDSSFISGDLPFLVAETDETPEHIEAVKAALKDVAEAEFAKAYPKLKFFFVGKHDGCWAHEEMAHEAKITENDKLYIVDQKKRLKYVAVAAAITAESVSAFVGAFLSGALEGVSTA